MAYKANDLSVLSYANGFTLWHYVSASDTSATLAGANYFDSASDLVNAGDLIVAFGSDGSSLLRVSAVSAGSVTVAANSDPASFFLPVVVPSLAAAAEHYAVSPVAGSVVSVRSVIEGSVDVDTTLTSKIGGVAITDGAITVTASGSAAGDTDSAAPSAANTVSAGDPVSIACGGEGSTASRALVVFEIDRG